MVSACHLYTQLGSAVPCAASEQFLSGKYPKKLIGMGMTPAGKLPAVYRQMSQGVNPESKPLDRRQRIKGTSAGHFGRSHIGRKQLLAPNWTERQRAAELRIDFYLEYGNEWHDRCEAHLNTSPRHLLGRMASIHRAHCTAFRLWLTQSPFCLGQLASKYRLDMGKQCVGKQRPRLNLELVLVYGAHLAWA